MGMTRACIVRRRGTMRRGGRWTVDGERVRGEQRRLAVTTVYTMRRGCRNRVLIEGKGTFEDMRRWGSESVCRTEKGGCQHGTITLIEIEIAAYGRKNPGGRGGAKGRGLAGRAEGGTRDGGRCWAERTGVRRRGRGGGCRVPDRARWRADASIWTRTQKGHVGNARKARIKWATRAQTNGLGSKSRGRILALARARDPVHSALRE